MKRFLLLFLATVVTAWSASAQLSVSQLRTEHLTDPVGIGERRPLLSWEVSDASRRGVTQSAYEIRVKSGGRTVWRTGKVASAESAGVFYDGTPLTSDTRYTWQVRVWDDRGKASAWSRPAFWRTGLFDVGEWQARWIEPAVSDDLAAMFRRTFRVTKPVAEATVYVTAHGIYEASVNGHRVSDDLLTPGWTAYKKRLQYQAYDITPLVVRGDNAIGVTVAKGWWLSKLPWSREFNYGDKYGLLAQIVLRYKDGTKEVIATDDTWRASTGEVSYGNLYDGETIDLNRRQKGWDTPSFDDASWASVQVADTSLDNLTASVSPAVRVIETFKPVKIFTTPSGARVIDFGQNISGRERVRLRGQRGDTVRIYHSEILEKGEFFTRNLRKAKALSTYYPFGGGRGVARAPVRLLRLPLHQGGGNRRRAEPRGFRRRGDQFGDARERYVRFVRLAHQPVAVEYQVGDARQLRRYSDRLPAARRASGLDGRRAGLLPHGDVQPRRADLLQQVDGRRGR